MFVNRFYNKIRVANPAIIHHNETLFLFCLPKMSVVASVNFT